MPGPTPSSTARRLLTRSLLGLVCLTTLQCTVIVEGDLCSPQRAQVGFFSMGDCELTRSRAFRGHEWLTFLGNTELPSTDQFSDGEIEAIVEGNRRVDFPKELLVHLNVGVLAYVHALEDYHNDPANQAVHFLLDDRNFTPKAIGAAHDELLSVSQEMVALWTDNRTRSLTLAGRGCHLLQDSFSPAHTCRALPKGGSSCDPDDETDAGAQAPWCITEIKAYMPRDPSVHDEDVERGISYHGGPEVDDADEPAAESAGAEGHITPQDSIYVTGRECRSPDSAAAVEACLNKPARRAVCATRDYLATLQELVRSGASESEVERRIGCYEVQHLGLCADASPTCDDVSFPPCP